MLWKIVHYWEHKNGVRGEAMEWLYYLLVPKLVLARLKGSKELADGGSCVVGHGRNPVPVCVSSAE